jgi:PHD/YefM family antitoxin component YafN of YafNO toxin-antitoxin module
LAQLRPQRVTSRGRDAVVVLSAAEYDRLQQRKRSKSSLLEFLSNTGFSELDLERRTDLNRDIEL